MAWVGAACDLLAVLDSAPKDQKIAACGSSYGGMRTPRPASTPLASNDAHEVLNQSPRTSRRIIAQRYQETRKGRRIKAINEPYAQVREQLARWRSDFTRRSASDSLIIAQLNVGLFPFY
ncbi:hypothetical protein [Pseudomonas fluorescens]|uniref:hypothetical protein n=1 Tax=Pseudomonas fluorescens TaxID=294 RepID=UPI00123F8F5C|nr:hypothetical protein [Pseudomonas fluorescens]